MFFFVRFAIAVLLVCFALDWRAGGPSAVDGQRSRTPPESAITSGVGRTVAAGMTAARARADALAQAAQKKCASDSARCLELAHRFRAFDAR